MNASSRRILRLGLTAGLSLGAIVGLVGCAEQADDVAIDEAASVESINGLSINGLSINGLSANGLSINGLSANGLSANGLSANGLSMNGLSMNGLSMNGLSANGLSMNGLSINGLASTGGLSSTSGMMTTAGGREVLKYLVKVAFPAGHNLTKQDQFGNSYTFEGGIGVAPEFEFGTAAGGNACGTDCQEKVSGAMLAHVNNAGMHVGIWLVGPDSGIGWGSSPNYPYKEAGYFGNLFASNMPGNYCAGKDMGSGDAKGRLGSPFGNNSAVLNSPYGWIWDGATSQNVPNYCTSGGCVVQNEGYASCPDPYGGSGHPNWTHVVTVWRNFESSQLYKICNRSSGKCLGVVGGSMANGANIEQRTFTAAAGQTWKILQVSPGNYKIINKTSGMSLDVNGTQVVQRPYASQTFPMTFISDLPGFANLKLSTNTSAVFWNNWSGNDGGLIQTTSQSTSDCAKWSIIAVALDTFDPGSSYRLVPQHATTKSVDVAYGNTAPGTWVQQYNTWNGNPQKFFIKDAGGGNVKFAMKADANKCLGPIGGNTASGTMLEVQNCNGQFNQAWINVQTTSTSGIFIYRNAANPAVCMDVAGGTGATGDGARIQMYTCSGALNQRFAAVSAP